MDCQVEYRDKSHGEIYPEVISKHCCIPISTTGQLVHYHKPAISISTVSQCTIEDLPEAHQQRQSVAEKVGGEVGVTGVRSAVVYEEKVEIDGKASGPEHGADREEV